MLNPLPAKSPLSALEQAFLEMSFLTQRGKNPFKVICLAQSHDLPVLILINQIDWALKSLRVKHFLQSSNRCVFYNLPRLFIDFRNVKAGTEAHGKTPSPTGGRGDAQELLWHFCCNRNVLSVQIVLTICISGVTLQSQLTDIKRDNVNQNENVHWGTF